MVEILDTLIQFFCPTSESYSYCQQFVNEFAYQGPLQQILYFLFFPTIFIIVFILILVSSAPAIGNNKGIQLLVALGVYVFIIVSGWYPLTLSLSRFWFVVLIVLALLYFVKRHFAKGEGSGGKGSMPGIGGQIMDLAKRELGETITHERKDLENTAKHYLEQLEILAKRIKHTDTGSMSYGKLWEEYRSSEQNFISAYKQLTGAVSLETDFGKVKFGRYKHLIDKFRSIQREMTNEEKKFHKH